MTSREVDYYTALNILPNLGQAEVTSAYERLASAKDEQDESVFSDPQLKELRRVYEILSDLQERVEYDAWLKANDSASLVIGPDRPRAGNLQLRYQDLVSRRALLAGEIKATARSLRTLEAVADEDGDVRWSAFDADEYAHDLALARNKLTQLEREQRGVCKAAQQLMVSLHHLCAPDEMIREEDLVEFKKLVKATKGAALASEALTKIEVETREFSRSSRSHTERSERPDPTPEDLTQFEKLGNVRMAIAYHKLELDTKRARATNALAAHKVARRNQALLTALTAICNVLLDDRYTNDEARAGKTRVQVAHYRARLAEANMKLNEAGKAVDSCEPISSAARDSENLRMAHLEAKLEKDLADLQVDGGDKEDMPTKRKRETDGDAASSGEVKRAVDGRPKTRPRLYLRSIYNM